MSVLYLASKQGFNVLLSAAITVVLFLIMMVLIKTENVNIKEITKIKIDPFIHEHTPITEQKIDLEELKPIEPVVEPDLELDPIVIKGGVHLGGITYRPPVTNKGDGPSIADGGPVSIMKVAPIYPDVAARRGIEGYVDVRFSVTSSGTTSSVVVIQANPERIFNKSAIRAVKRWKYKPKMDDGIAVQANDIYARIRFSLDS
jgi:protein TonB